jgi:hypothetical protein
MILIIFVMNVGVILMNNEKTYIERLEYKLGYQDGFVDGFKAAKHCLECYNCSDCDPQSYDITKSCPYSQYKEVFVI